MGENISKTAAVVGCSGSAVVCIYQKCGPKYEQWWIGDMVMAGQGSLMGSEGLPVWSDPKDELL